MVIGEGAECHQSSYLQSASYPTVTGKLRTNLYNPSGMYGMKAMDNAAPEYEYPGKNSATSDSFIRARPRHQKEVRSMYLQSRYVDICTPPPPHIAKLRTVLVVAGIHYHPPPTHTCMKRLKMTKYFSSVTDRSPIVNLNNGIYYRRRHLLNNLCCYQGVNDIVGKPLRSKCPSTQYSSYINQ